MIAAPHSQERKNLARGWELRGVIRCPSCGAAMSSHTATRGEKLYNYYRCLTDVIAALTTGAALASKGWSEPKRRRRPCGNSSPVS
jgi:hypothetical protein